MNLEKLIYKDGFARPRSWPAEPGTEARVEDYDVRKLLKNTGIDHQKVFCYSKVLNALKLKSVAQLNFKAEPWMNCIAIDGYILAYIWDNRILVAVDKNPKAAEVLKKAPWKECVHDAYNAFSDQPMLVDQNKLGMPGAANSALKKWVQPWIHIMHYQTRTLGDGTKQYEYEIVTTIKNLGEILIGEYNVKPKGSSYTVELDMDPSLVADVFPMLPSGAQKFLVNKGTKLLSFLDIQYALLNALTS